MRPALLSAPSLPPRGQRKGGGGISQVHRSFAEGSFRERPPHRQRTLRCARHMPFAWKHACPPHVQADPLQSMSLENCTRQVWPSVSIRSLRVSHRPGAGRLHLFVPATGGAN
eukprot:366110-Chlamydomonas_euryale.AAC.13